MKWLALGQEALNDEGLRTQVSPGLGSFPFIMLLLPHPYVHHPVWPSSLQHHNHNRTLSVANDRDKNKFNDCGFRPVLPLPSAILFLTQPQVSHSLP